MPTTLEELLVRIAVHGTSRAVRDIGTLDRAIGQTARSAQATGPAAAQGFAAAGKASATAAKATTRAAEGQARDQARFAAQAARETTRQVAAAALQQTRLQAAAAIEGRRAQERAARAGSQAQARAAREVTHASAASAREQVRLFNQVARESERTSQRTIRAGERAAQGATRAAQVAAREQIRLSHQMARERAGAGRSGGGSLLPSLLPSLSGAGAVAGGMAALGGATVATAGAAAALAGIAAGAAGAARGLQAAVTEAAAFDQTMRNVNSIAQLSEAEFGRLRKAVTGIAGDPEIRQGPRDLATALYDITSAGFGGQKALDVLKESARGASAGMTDTKTAADVLTTVLNSNIRGVAGARQGMDSLFKIIDRGKGSFSQLAGSLGMVLPTASQAGVSIQEVGAFLSIATKQGQTFSEASSDLLNLITKLIRPSQEASDRMRELGISHGIAALQTKGLAGILGEIAAKTKGNDQALTEIIPDMQAFRALMAAGSRDGAGFREELGHMARASEGLGSTQKALNEQNKGFNAQLEIFRKELSKLGIAIGSEALPPLTELIQAASRGLRAFQTMGEGLSELKPLFQPAATFARAFADELGGIGKSIGSLLGRIGALTRSDLLPWMRSLEVPPALAGFADTLGKILGAKARMPTGILGLPGQLLTKGAASLLRQPQPTPFQVPREPLVLRPQPKAGAGLDALTVRPGIEKRLTPTALQELGRLDDTLAGLKQRAFVTSDLRTTGPRSHHRGGNAVDIFSRGNMREMEKQLQAQGFRAQFERKGQLNPNGSRATGDHIHVTLLPPKGGAAAAAAGQRDTGAPMFPPDRRANKEAQEEQERQQKEIARNQADFRKRLSSEEAQARGEALKAFLIENRQPGITDPQLTKLFQTQEAGKSAQQREQERLQRQETQADFRRQMAAEQARLRGETEAAFVIESRRPGISDRQLREQFNLEQTRAAKDAQREQQRQAETERREAEDRQLGTLADTVQGFRDERQVADLRRTGQRQEADWLETLRGNEDLNALLSEQPNLMAQVREEWGQLWDAQNLTPLEAATDSLAGLRAELTQTAEDARAAAAGLEDSFQGGFTEFARQRPEVLDAFMGGDLVRMAEIVTLFSEAEQAQRAVDPAQRMRELNVELERRREILRGTPLDAFAIGLETLEGGQRRQPFTPKEIRQQFTGRQEIERDEQRLQSRTEIDQRRRALRGGEFGQFAVGREQIDASGRARQPFDMRELRQQFDLSQQLDQLETAAGGVRDVFLQAFSAIGSGAQGFFSSLFTGFQQMLQRMAAEFLASQVTNFLMQLAGGLLGGSSGGGESVFGSAGIPAPAAAGWFGPKAMALGGPVTGGRPYLVGEQGPELFVPHTAGRIQPNHAATTGGGSGARGPVIVNMTINTPNATSFRASERQIMADVKRGVDRATRDG